MGALCASPRRVALAQWRTLTWRPDRTPCLAALERLRHCVEVNPAPVRRDPFCTRSSRALVRTGRPGLPTGSALPSWQTPGKAAVSWGGATSRHQPGASRGESFRADTRPVASPSANPVAPFESPAESVSHDGRSGAETERVSHTSVWGRADLDLICRLSNTNSPPPLFFCVRRSQTACKPNHDPHIAVWASAQCVRKVPRAPPKSEL